MLWSRLKRKVKEKGENNLVELAKHGLRMKMWLSILGTLPGGEKDFNRIKGLIREIDKNRSVVFEYLVDISSQDKRLVGDLRKILYQLEQCKAEMFTAGGEYSKNAYLGYETLNSSILTTIKQSLEDYLHYGNKRSFKVIIKQRVGFWVDPLLMVKRVGGSFFGGQEQKVLDDVSGMYPPRGEGEEDEEEDEE